MPGFVRSALPNQEINVGDFPAPNFPVIYADSLFSLTRAHPVIKMYFFRYDPHPYAEGGASQQPVMQVVMPQNALPAMVVFLTQQLALLAKDGQISKAILEQVKRDVDSAMVSANA